MKKSFITTMVAVPLLSLSSMAFVAEPVATEPMLLTSAQMDGVTAGSWRSRFSDLAYVKQSNTTVVGIVQSGRNNDAFVLVDNSISIRQ